MKLFNNFFSYTEDYQYKQFKFLFIKITIKKYIYKKSKDNDFLYREIEKYDVISFDIFDTLLVRPYAKPTDLFLHLEYLYNAEGFHKKRIEAEKIARKNNNYEEVGIDDIYEEITEEFKFLKEKEIELEKQILTSHREMKNIYDYALSLGKKVIITSDMYLPKYIIEDILSKNGFLGYYKLYLSSDKQLSKYTGKLYGYILDDLNINPNNILHIGDNYQSDFVNAKNFGINAELCSKIVDILLSNNKRAKILLDNNKDNLFASIIIGILSLGIFNKNNKEYWNNFGFTYAGPAILAYSYWLNKKSYEDNIDRLFFIARDGFTLKKVFDIINKGNIKSEYIYAPRILYTLITLDYEIKSKFFPVEYFEDIKLILTYFKDKDEYLKEHTPNSFSSEEGHKFILKNIERYKKLANAEYNKYKTYIEKYIQTNEKIGVVDTCSYFISSQKLISLYSDKKNIVGYYFHTHNITDIYSNFGFNIKSFKDKKEYLFYNWNLMEFFMTSDEPPIKNIVNGKPLYCNADAYEIERIKVYKFVSNGAVEFSKTLNEIFGNTDIFIDYKVIVDYVNILSTCPNELDKKYVKNLMHAWNSSHKNYVQLFNSWFMRKQKKIYYLFSIIPILSRYEFEDSVKYYFLSFIPIIKKDINKNKYYLLSFIPILKIKV